MPEDDDYREALDGTVGEARYDIEQMDVPDYQRLLELEEEGKDRVTLKRFIRSQMDEEPEETAGEGETEEEDTEQEEEETGLSDEGLDLDAPEQMLSGPDRFLDSFSVTELLVLGLFIGIVVGLVVGYNVGDRKVTGPSGDVQQARTAVSDLVGAGTFNGTVNVPQPETRHGMFYFNVSFSQETPNGTVTNYREIYMTKDAELLFPVVSFPFQSPINVQERISQLQQSGQQGQTG